MVSGKVRPPRIDLANEDLVRSHVHTIWLAEIGMSLGHSLSDVLDVSGTPPTLALLADKAGDLANTRQRRTGTGSDRAGSRLKLATSSPTPIGGRPDGSLTP